MASSEVNMFVARQPILNRTKNTVGYELLFRSGLENSCRCADGDFATMSVVRTSLMDIGLQKLTGGKKAFINCTRELIVRGFIELIPKSLVVCEVLEDVMPDADVRAALTRLRSLGYLIALDDVATENLPELLPYADILKVDFRLCSPEVRASIANQAKTKKVALLAEKVETAEEFQEAVKLGYTYFQGYFIARPEMMTSKRPTQVREVKLALLSEIATPEFDLDRAENLVKRDPSMAYGLLRMVNSAFFALPQPIASLMDALMYLGRQRVRNWIMVMVMTDLGENRPAELMVKALQRAIFCERIAPALNMKERAGELFMTGILSLMDAVMGEPMEQALSVLKLPDDIRLALLERGLPLGPVLRLAEACEIGDWSLVGELSGNLGLTEEKIASEYRDAMIGTDMLLDMKQA
jgi:EAL and modified HD-GYP domain-containing signal transduction protein